MAAFYIPERSRSLTVDLWSNVAWSEPTEAASVPSSTLFQAPFAYCQTMPSIALQGRRRVTGRLPISPFLPSPVIGSYCCLGTGAQAAATLWVLLFLEFVFLY